MESPSHHQLPPIWQSMGTEFEVRRTDVVFFFPFFFPSEHEYEILGGCFSFFCFWCYFFPNLKKQGSQPEKHLLLR